MISLTGVLFCSMYLSAVGAQRKEEASPHETKPEEGEEEV
jgi:hypothetical protein